MVKFTAKKLRSYMEKKYNIRNVSVIANWKHGKSKLIDYLVAVAGISDHEPIGNVSSSSSNISSGSSSSTSAAFRCTSEYLYYEMPDESLKNYDVEKDGNEYLINLVDTPGHADFCFEVMASLRISDGALLVVDCIEDICVHTNTLLQQAIHERVRPVLIVNKIDICFLELPISGEDAYQILSDVIDNANKILATNEDPLFGDIQFCPVKGNVAFSAGLHGWAFTLADFAKACASHCCIDESKAVELLWGENFYDPHDGEWTSVKADCSIRGFVKFCYEPIRRIIHASVNNEKKQLWLELEQLGVGIESGVKHLTDVSLMQHVMRAWLPAEAAILKMIIVHLPSPAEAQMYRVQNLYGGPPNDIYATAIKICDPNGRLVLFVSKMIPASESGSFFAFGRVFSGSVVTGMKVYIMGPNYPRDKRDVHEAIVLHTGIWMGKKLVSMDEVSSGNLVTLAGLDQHITMSATLTDVGEALPCPIRAMKFPICPVVRAYIKHNSEPKLKESLESLAKSHPILCVNKDSSQYCIAGAGDFHLHICLNDLRDDFMAGAQIDVSEITASYCETVRKKGDIQIGRSENEQNKLSIRASPLKRKVLNAILKGRFDPRDDREVCFEMLSKEFGWERKIAKKIICFGPEIIGPNIFLNMCENTDCIDKSIGNTIVAAFQRTSRKGAIAGERMHGILFDVYDVTLSADASERDDKQISCAVEIAIRESQRAAKPSLVEPVYKVEIQAPEYELDRILCCLERRGVYCDWNVKRNTQHCTVIAELLVREYLLLSNELKHAALGQHSIQCLLRGWKYFEDEETSSKAKGADCLLPEKASHVTDAIISSFGI